MSGKMLSPRREYPRPQLYLIFFLCMSLLGCGREEVLPTGGASSSSQIPKQFVRVSGTKLVVGESDGSFRIRGVNMNADALIPPDGGEWVSDGALNSPPFPTGDDYIPQVLSFDWFNEDHFKAAREVGFNVIRVQLTYRIFEDNSQAGVYKQAAWTWLDKWIGWAKNNDLYLILSMAVPVGGYQPSGGQGAALWDDSEVTERQVALWKEIASRYKTEAQILAYDLINEPNPTPNSTGQKPWGAEKWASLAKTLISEIRAVDPNHIIVVEMVNWVVHKDGWSHIGRWSLDVLDGFQFLIRDDSGNPYSGIVYDFHYYVPVTYTLPENPGGNPTPSIYPSAATVETLDGKAMAFDKQYLRYELELLMKFSRTNSVPSSIGEWSGHTFYSVPGGDQYVRDLLCLFEEAGANWAHYNMNNFYTSGSLSELAGSRVQMFKDYFSDPAGFCETP